jgi:hypothetical protein
MGFPMLPPSSQRRRKNLWFERVMAIAAVANLGLVVFDLTYVSWRNFWLQGNIPIPLVDMSISLPIPRVDCPDRSVNPVEESPRSIRTSWITCLYDPIKGIEPHRDIQQYLNTVDALKQQVSQTGVQSSQAQQRLDELGQLSEEMIRTNPFQVANKSGTLEKIKQLMRQHIYETRRRTRSATEAFKVFWTERCPADWNQEIQWFDKKIRPLMETNYFRTIAVDGEFTSNFGRIDILFSILFFLEFLARTLYLSRRHVGLSWRDTMLWRWYDILLFFPFWLLFPVWAWLRVIPVAVRLHQAELVNMERVQAQVTQGFVAAIGEEITEVVVIQVLNQIQVAVQRGDISRWLIEASSRQRITVNNIDEVAEITSILAKTTIYQVFPKIQPDLEALLRHSIVTVLEQSPPYQMIKTWPGLENLQIQLTQRLATEVVQTAHNTLTGVMEDKMGAELTNRLVQNFSEALGTEVQQQEVIHEIQLLLTDLLEEVKLNYVQRSAELDVEAVMEETRQLQQLAANKNKGMQHRTDP